MSKNKKILLLTIATVIFIATVVISSSGCSDDGVLKTPDGLKIEDEILTFNEVDGAESYLISVDGSEYETKSPTFDLFEIFNEYKTYEIKVCALGDLKNTFDSEFSLPISYNVYSEHDLSFSPIQNSDECMVFATDPAKIKGKLIIPEASPDGKKVTMIGFPSMDDYAFCGAVNLTSVLIHDGITIIETRAFKDCTNLKRVRIPEELKKINKEVFENTAITAIEFNAELTEISGLAFNNSKLTKVSIPSSVTKIEPTAFAFCDDLTEITVDNENPIYKSENNAIIRKADQALIVGIKTTEIPNSVIEIDNFAFAGVSFKKIDVPANVKIIGANAFAKCGNLTEITLNDGLEEISERVFFNDDELTSIKIPKTVKTIGTAITYGCDGITEITVDDDNEFFYAKNNTLVRKLDDAVIAGCKTSVIPENAKLIENLAFASIPLQSFTIPKNVESIEDEAFLDCIKLKEINLCDGIKKIGNNAFQGCNALEYVVIPESVEEIGVHVFSAELMAIVLPSTVKTIGECCFTGTIYTDAKVDNEGWAQATDGKKSWHFSSNTGVVYGCTFLYDGDEKYIHSFTLTYSAYKIISSDPDGEPVTTYLYYPSFHTLSLPHRKGYKFIGLSTDSEGKNIVSRISYYAENEKVTERETTLTLKEAKALSDNTVLYTVWEKID